MTDTKFDRIVRSSGLRRHGLRLAAFAVVALSSAVVFASPDAHGGDHAGGLSIFADRDFWLHWPTKQDSRTGYLWMLINFGLLMLVLNKLLFKNLRSANAEKSDHIKLELERASEARAKAEGLLGEYKGRLSDLQVEIDSIKKQAAEMARVEGQAIIEEAKEEAEKIRRAAAESAEREAVRRQRQIESEVVERAMAKAEAMIAQSFGDADQRRLIDSYITEVSSVDLQAERKAS